MVKFLINLFFVISMLFAPLKSFGAEPVKVTYIASIYFDSKGSGLKLPEGIACNEKLLLVADTGNNRLLRYIIENNAIKGGEEIKLPELSYPIRVQVNSRGEIFGIDSKQRRIARLNPEGALLGFIELKEMPSPEAFMPRSFKIGYADNIYVLDILSERVVIIDLEGKYQKQIEFPKNYGFFSDLAIDSKGGILLMDTVGSMVYRASKDSKSFSPVTGNLKEYANFPTGITTDNTGGIYLVDQNSGGILILGQDGSFQTRLLSFGWDEGFLNYPTQLCINGEGKMFITDRNNNRIQIFSLVK
ncbi:MAG TPA: NHL repeat-containing protein [bacterium]